MNSSNAIKSYRGKLLLTQDEIADKMGVSRQMYNGYENDPLHTSLENILKLLSCLNVTEEQIEEFLIALKQDYMSYQSQEIKEE